MRPTSNLATARAAALVTLTVAGLGFGQLPADASATDSCANASIRAQQNSERLPDCRGYELVSPADKNGYPIYDFGGPPSIGLVSTSPDGDRAVFPSWGIFADASNGLPQEYRAQRSASGWATTTVSPAGDYPNPDAISGKQIVWTAAARDLNVGFIQTSNYFGPTDETNGSQDVYAATDANNVSLLSRGDGSESTLGATASFAGANDDGSHALFTTSAHLDPGDAGRESSVNDLYERSRGHTYLVNVAPGGGGPATNCGSLAGDSLATPRHVISSDGSRIFFESPSGNGSDPSCSDPTQLYLRINHQTTVHVSASRRTPADPAGTRGARYLGASAEGAKVIFSSDEMLTDDATVGGGVYEYNVDTDTLTFLLGTDVERVVGMSDDGSHVYFVSRSQLVPGEGTAGNDNLYSYYGGQVHWIVDSGSVDGLSTFVPGSSSVADLDEASRPINISPDGKHLFLSALSNLTAYDSHGKSEAYLYNEDDNSFVCVSCGAPGTVPTADTFVRPPSAPFGALLPKTMSDDGTTVVFATKERLSPDDSNAASDVYEYRAGTRTLLSGGHGSKGSIVVGISSDGRDAFFSSYDTLVPQDVDGGNEDLYDARIGGGFPYSSSVTVDCSGDACQGGPSGEPSPIQPPSTFFRGAGDIAQGARGAFAVRRITASQKANMARTGRLNVRVKVNVSGKVSALATARLGKRTRAVAKGSKTATRAGTVSVTLTLSRAARRELALRHKLSVKVTVAFNKMRQSKTLTFRLVAQNHGGASSVQQATAPLHSNGR